MEGAAGIRGAARAPRRGEQLELDVDSLAFGGRGVARADGFVVFVAGALPGDRVRAEVTKGKKRFAEARTVELISASPDRLTDRCVHGGEPCPGAPWQGLPYEQQLHYKQEQVADALGRIGGLEGFELEEIVPAVEQWRYRNKLEYSFGEEGDELTLGFHARGRWDL
ncbi:MAG: class I SAM-dependent RNA methyltransferase, partial [Solirubrobacterales bacterium]